MIFRSKTAIIASRAAIVGTCDRASSEGDAND
jgi:hypothetical protein